MEYFTNYCAKKALENFQIKSFLLPEKIVDLLRILLARYYYVNCCILEQRDVWLGTWEFHLERAVDNGGWLADSSMKTESWDRKQRSYWWLLSAADRSPKEGWLLSPSVMDVMIESFMFVSDIRQTKTFWIVN